MKIETNINDGVSVVTIDGRLDTTTSSGAHEHLNGLLDGGAVKIAIDFGKVDYVSSAGLRILLATAKRMNGVDGKLALFGLNESVQEVFDMSGFSSLLNVVASLPEAMSSF